jgi:hypothetical protein
MFLEHRHGLGLGVSYRFHGVTCNPKTVMKPALENMMAPARPSVSKQR